MIELLVTLAIVVCLISVGIPSFIDFLVRTKVDNEIYRVSKLLQVARNTSIHSNSYVTVCPVDTNTLCQLDWSKTIIVFTDANNNKVFEPHLGEQQLSHKDATSQGDKLLYARTRTGITYAPTGHLSGWGQNGTFKYCPKDHYDKARGIVVATSGRIYQSFQNLSGRNITRSRRTISCT
ncbi:type IV minor pilin protein FimT [Thalassotalea marina]|uniref:Type II secretion system protein H n=1 Tax=Thalassotalea marina TaxID=1673741 RepID=A0A919BPN2_9GAMM|nr:type IV minor pilin protein FimT [Thalassotalea marina]